MENDSVEAKSDTSNKRKKQYSHVAQKRRKFILEPGLKGFLCSCNFREKDCIRESYNLLNEYGDKLCGSERAKDESLEDVANTEEDIDSLHKEIESLQAESKEIGRRFQVVESGAKNFLFIRTTIDEPVKLAEAIVKDIYENKKQKTRFLLRLIPVEATCKAYVDEIEKACEPLIEKYFKDSPKSYSIVFNRRNNSKLSKDDVIKGVADMVAAKRADHKVDLKNAEVSIVIEVIRSIALLGVVPNFTKYKKYNLHRVCEGEADVVVKPSLECVPSNGSVCEGEADVVVEASSECTPSNDSSDVKPV